MARRALVLAGYNMSACSEEFWPGMHSCDQALGWAGARCRSPEGSFLVVPCGQLKQTAADSVRSVCYIMARPPPHPPRVPIFPTPAAVSAERGRQGEEGARRREKGAEIGRGRKGRGGERRARRNPRVQCGAVQLVTPSAMQAAAGIGFANEATCAPAQARSDLSQPVAATPVYPVENNQPTVAVRRWGVMRHRRGGCGRANAPLLILDRIPCKSL